MQFLSFFRVPDLEGPVGPGRDDFVPFDRYGDAYPGAPVALEPGQLLRCPGVPDRDGVAPVRTAGYTPACLDGRYTRSGGHCGELSEWLKEHDWKSCVRC